MTRELTLSILLTLFLATALIAETPVAKAKAAITNGTVAPGAFTDEVLLKAFDQIIDEHIIDRKDFERQWMRENMLMSMLPLAEKLSEEKRKVAEKAFLNGYARLGAKHFKERRKAYDELKSGTIFVKRLEALLQKEEDPEIRVNGRRILKHWQEMVDEARKQEKAGKRLRENTISDAYRKEAKAKAKKVREYWARLPKGYAKTRAILNWNEGLDKYSKTMAMRLRETVDDKIQLEGLTPKQRIEVITFLLKTEWPFHWPHQYWSQLTVDEWNNDALMETLGTALCKKKASKFFLHLFHVLPTDVTPQSWVTLVHLDPKTHLPLAYLLLRNGKTEYLDNVAQWFSQSSDKHVDITIGGGGSYSDGHRSPFFYYRTVFHPAMKPHRKALLNAYFSSVTSSSRVGIQYEYLQTLGAVTDPPELNDLIMKHSARFLDHSNILLALEAAILRNERGIRAFPKDLVARIDKTTRNLQPDDLRNRTYEGFDGQVSRLITMMAVRLRTGELDAATETAYRRDVKTLFASSRRVSDSQRPALSLVKTIIHPCGIYPEVRKDVINQLSFNPKESWNYEPELCIDVLMEDARHRGDVESLIQTYARDVLKTGKGNTDAAAALFACIGEYDNLLRIYKDRLNSRPKDVPYDTLTTLIATKPEVVFTNAKLRERVSSSSAFLQYDWTVSKFPYVPNYYAQLKPANRLRCAKTRDKTTLTLEMLTPDKKRYFNEDNALELSDIATNFEEGLPVKLIKRLYDLRDPNGAYSTDAIDSDVVKILYKMGASLKDLEAIKDPGMKDLNRARLSHLQGDYETAWKYIQKMESRETVDEPHYYDALYLDTLLALAEKKSTPAVATALKQRLDEIKAPSTYLRLEGGAFETLVNWGRYDEALAMLKMKNPYSRYSYDFHRNSNRSLSYRHVWLCIEMGCYDMAEAMCRNIMVSNWYDNDFDYGIFVLKLLQTVKKNEWKNYSEAIKQVRLNQLDHRADALEKMVDTIENKELRAMVYYQLGAFAYQCKEAEKCKAFWRSGTALGGTHFGEICRKYVTVSKPEDQSAVVTGNYYSITPLPERFRPRFLQMGVAKKIGKAPRTINYVEFRDTLGIPRTKRKRVGFLLGGQGWWMAVGYEDPFKITPGTWCMYLEHDKGSELHRRVILPNHAGDGSEPRAKTGQ